MAPLCNIDCILATTFSISEYFFIIPYNIPFLNITRSSSVRYNCSSLNLFKFCSDSFNSLLSSSFSLIFEFTLNWDKDWFCFNEKLSNDWYILFKLLWLLKFKFWLTLFDLVKDTDFFILFKLLTSSALIELSSINVVILSIPERSKFIWFSYLLFWIWSKFISLLSFKISDLNFKLSSLILFQIIFFNFHIFIY